MKKFRAKLLCLMVATNAQGLFAVDLPQKSEVATLKSTTLEFDDKSQVTTIDLSFDREIKEEDIKPLENHGGFLQLNVSSTQTAESGKFIDGSPEAVPKVGIFQVNPSTTGVRLFLAKEAEDILQRTKVDHLKDHLIITIDSKSKENNNLATAITDVKLDHKNAQELTVDKAATAEQDPKVQSTGLKFSGALVKIAMFFGLFLGLATLLIISRRKLRRLFKRTTKNDFEDSVQLIKTLETVSLGKMQNLTLLEISGEKVLLSSSPSGVQFLTKLGVSNQLDYNRSWSESGVHSRRSIEPQESMKVTETNLRRSGATLKLRESVQTEGSQILNEKNVQHLERSANKGVGFQRYLESDSTDVLPAPSAKDNHRTPSKSAAEAKLQSLIRNKLKEIPKI